MLGETQTLDQKSILSNVIKGLYDSANTMLGNFGLSIPKVVIGITFLISVLLLWSLIAAMRNRKSFSLVDEEDSSGELRESADRVRSGVFRPTRGPEGSEGVLS